MSQEREKQRKVTTVETQLDHQARRNNIVLAVVTVLSAVALAMLLAHLLGMSEMPPNR